MNVNTGLLRSGASRIAMPLDFSRYWATPRKVSTCSTLAGGAALAAPPQSALPMAASGTSKARTRIDREARDGCPILSSSSAQSSAPSPRLTSLQQERDTGLLGSGAALHRA